MTRLFLILMVFVLSCCALKGNSVTLQNEKVYAITNFGAVPDTSKLSTAAIQNAINHCSESGGGKVIVPAGSFKTGTIYLKNNVTIHLEKGAILYGSKRLTDYPENIPDFIFFRKDILRRALIYAEKSTNIAIEGEGTINGQGENFIVPEGSKVNSYTVRPYLIWMIQCSEIRIEGVKLRNSAFWMEHYLACDNLLIHNVEVFNHCNKNNDMIDIDGCQNVKISDFTGDSDDDGITFKSTCGRPNKNIVITNCILSSHCNAIKIGTESSTGFFNIAISNVVVRPSIISDRAIYGKPQGHTGIALETVDGGSIDGVVINNIRIDGPACPIFIRRGFRARPYFAGQKIEQPGELKNISVSNVVATGASVNGCPVSGIPGFPVENINLSNISIKFDGGGNKKLTDKQVPENEKDYPEFNMFGDLPAFGFYIRHAKNIRFSNVHLKTESPDARPAVFLSDTHNSRFDNITVNNTGPSINIVSAEKSSNIVLNGFTAQNSGYFLNLRENENSGFSLINNVLTQITKLVYPENQSESVVRQSGNLK